MRPPPREEGRIKIKGVIILFSELLRNSTKILTSYYMYLFLLVKSFVDNSHILVGYAVAFYRFVAAPRTEEWRLLESTKKLLQPSTVLPVLEVVRSVPD